MPTPAPSIATEPTKDKVQAADGSWYAAFVSPDETQPPQTAETTEPPAVSGDPDILNELQPSDIPGPHQRNAEMPWQNLLHLQQAEIDRLARANEKLMIRIDTMLNLQAREQTLREQLQGQIEQMRGTTATADLDAVRREARAGVTEELKPVLMAILDALERFAIRPAEEPAPAEISEPEDPLRFEDYGKLPAILTRPLEELMEEGSEPGRSMSENPRQRPRKSVFRNRKQPRGAKLELDRPIEPGPFPSATLLSS